jgi:hypothetical protein
MRKIISVALVIAVLGVGLGFTWRMTLAVTPGLCPISARPITVSVRSSGVPVTYTSLSSSIDDDTYANPKVYSGATPLLHYLQTWHPSLVRLHFGFRGADISLPEEQYDKWNFYEEDTTIAALRAENISYVLNVRSAPPWMFNAYGKLSDPSFHEFAQYMARLVSWYNKGGFTDEAGVYHKSGHYGWVHLWEIWNEPSSSYEIPVPVPDKSSPFLDPYAFAQLYNTVVAAMRAVDPTIIVGDPALSGHTDTAFSDYIGPFIAHLTQPIGFISFHIYATGSATEPDSSALYRVNTRIPAVIASLGPIAASANHGHGVPIWLDETGFNESSATPYDPRDNSPITYAFISDLFIIAATHAVGMMDPFPLVGYYPEGLYDHNSHLPHGSFWLYTLLSQTMPAYSKILPVSNYNPNVHVMATLSPDKRTVHVLLSNIETNHPYDVNGPGVGTSVCIVLDNAHTGVWIPAGAHARTWSFDASVGMTTTMPAPHAQQMIVQPNQAIMVTYLPGYSATDIEIPV